MKKAVIYGRVSTSKQDFDRQVFELESFAKRNDFKIVDVFAEKISGHKRGKDRTEFERMREYVDQHGIDLILATEISRFGRTQLDTQINVSHFVEKKVNIYFKDANLYTLNKELKYDGITELHISILANRAQEESRTLKQRVKSGLRYSVSKGNCGSGLVVAYGFKNVDKKMVVDPDESEVIKLIFQKYLSGMGTQKIAKFLNAEGIQTRFNKIYRGRKIRQKYGIEKDASAYTWKDGTVYRILTNSLYYGDRKHNNEIFKIAPIISKPTFDLVQERLTGNFNKKNSNRKYENPLKDILVCGCCGRGYFMHKRHDNKDNAYKCVSKRYNETCGNPPVNIDKLLKSLFVTISPLIAVNKRLTDQHKENLLEQIRVIDENIKASEKEIKGMNSKLDNLIELNITGKLSIVQFSKFNTDLTSKIGKENAKLLALNNEKSILEAVRVAYPNKFEMLDEAIFRREIGNAIKKITIYSTEKVKPVNIQDIPVKIVVEPILTSLPTTEYVITSRTKIVHYITKNKVVKLLSLD